MEFIAFSVIGICCLAVVVMFTYLDHLRSSEAISNAKLRLENSRLRVELEELNELAKRLPLPKPNVYLHYSEKLGRCERCRVEGNVGFIKRWARFKLSKGPRGARLKSLASILTCNRCNFRGINIDK